MAKGRVIVVIGIIILIGGLVLGIDLLRRRAQESSIPPGSVPIYVEEKLIAAFTPNDLEQLEKVSFVDAEEGKTQEGWMLRDVLLLHISETDLSPETRITVSSSSRGKSAQVTWAEVSDSENMVMFDLANKGTLKLVSRLERLDVRDEWVQDVDRIELSTP
jgi:hypothetical protein